MSAAARTEAQVVVVTGAGSGIGRAIAEQLALAGHTVYALGIDHLIDIPVDAKPLGEEQVQHHA